MDQKPRQEAPRERIIKAARKLFDAKGFHATTTAELATEAAVSIGQIYRLFEGKDDVVISLVEENTQARITEMHAIFGAVERGEHSVFDAIKAIANISIIKSDGGLSFEILAEACRNPLVAERLTALVDCYRGGVRRLAALTRPDATAGELEAYVEIMMACFFGLGHRTLIAPATDVNQISHETACLLMRALGAPDQPTSPPGQRKFSIRGTSDEVGKKSGAVSAGQSANNRSSAAKTTATRTRKTAKR
ncbi:MAG: helix-turn-helix domain-containing protein [Sphingobium sp.]|uniref:TetR/AcrR family transcriptional regulator n=1 Tax=Sphingobium sp. TaxID=1912891 RepID=UPI0029B0A462|nr:helix-turn-helix domain-containing protein [Sphingobium sp.]MDX3910688.1 helix-turn-helix domain-containing protein [Sphingobium sp.]